MSSIGVSASDGASIILDGCDVKTSVSKGSHGGIAVAANVSEDATVKLKDTTIHTTQSDGTTIPKKCPIVNPCRKCGFRSMANSDDKQCFWCPRDGETIPDYQRCKSCKKDAYEKHTDGTESTRICCNCGFPFCSTHCMQTHGCAFG